MGRIPSEDKAGLYITVIVHLTVIIVLLASQIDPAMNGKESFLIDFSEKEAPQLQSPQEEEEPASFDEEVSRRVQEMISGTSGVAFRNVTVNSQLRDDRGTDAEKLYEDARKLAQDLKNGFEVDEPDDAYVAVEKPGKKDDTPAKTYSGPSVLSWTLEGRNASRLPIPAYRCMGAGMVTVIIGVDNSGRVVYAKVQDETSSSDRCLREFAIRAARMSQFSSSSKAPARQAGQIIYQFIAQ